MFNRYKEGFPERCKNAGINASKIPDIFLDALNFEIMDKIVIIDHVIGHAIDESSLPALVNGTNPFNGQPLNLINPGLKMHFGKWEILHIVQNLQEAHLRRAISHFGLYKFEDFTLQELKLIEQCCKTSNPDLLLKIDLFIKKKLEIQLYEQRETFISHVEKIKKNRELQTEVNKIDPMSTTERFDLFSLKLELIGEYASYITSTKAAINSSAIKEEKKLNEIKRVLTDAYELYNNEISNFMKWSTPEEKQLAGTFEKVYLEDSLAGVVIPHYGNLVREKVAEYERTIALRKMHVSSLHSFTHFRLQKPKVTPAQPPELPKPK